MLTYSADLDSAELDSADLDSADLDSADLDSTLLAGVMTIPWAKINFYDNPIYS